jgi:hypothetical protein
MPFTAEGRRKADETRARKKAEREAMVETVDPASLGDPEEGDVIASEAKQPSGRRRGKVGGKKPETKLDLQGVEALLLSIHYSLAALTKTPELALDPEEAANIARAAGNVARHYDIPEMPAKMIDWANLAICCAATYGPRVMAINERMKAARIPNGEIPAS